MSQFNRGEDVFPKFHQWKSEFRDPSLRLWDYINARADPEIVGAAATLFWPSVFERDGCVMLEERFSEDAFTQWRDHFHGDTAAIERVMNHVHLIDLFVNSYDDANRRTLEFVAQIMARCWRHALAEQLPRRQFEVEYDDDAEGNGPTLTFFEVT